MKKHAIYKLSTAILCALVTLNANADWNHDSCFAAKDYAKLAVIEYTTGSSLNEDFSYAGYLYDQSPNFEFTRDAAQLAVRFTWRYMVTIGMPQSPPPPEFADTAYNSIADDFFNWCKQQS